MNRTEAADGKKVVVKDGAQRVSGPHPTTELAEAEIRSQKKLAETKGDKAPDLSVKTHIEG